MNAWLTQLDFHSLALFVEVAKELNLTKAGAKFGLTQSAVSRQIQRLESIVGAQLLKRSTRSTRLTEQGKTFLEIARRVLTDFQAQMTEFEESNLVICKTARIGLSPSIPNAHIPGLISHYQKTNPTIRLMVESAPTNQLQERVLDGELDLAVFTDGGRAPEGLRRIHSFTDQFVIIEPSLKRKSPSSHERWITLPKQSTIGAMIHDWIDQLRNNEVARTEVHSFDLAIQLVESGLGSAFAPQRALRASGTLDLIERPNPNRRFERNVGIYSRNSSQLSPLIQSFAECVLFNWKPNK